MTVRESLITIIESRGTQSGNVTSYRHSHPAGIYVMEMASYDGTIGVVTCGLTRGPGEAKIPLFCSYSTERSPVVEVGCWERVIRELALHEHIYWLRIALRAGTRELDWSNPRRAIRHQQRMKQAVHWFKVVSCLPHGDRMAMLSIAILAQKAILNHNRN